MNLEQGVQVIDVLGLARRRGKLIAIVHRGARLTLVVARGESASDVDAGAVLREALAAVGGKGGGRPDMARAGGRDAGALDGALASVADWIREQA